MNKFMEKQGKKLALGAAIAMLIAFICNFSTTVLYLINSSVLTRRYYGYFTPRIFIARAITNDVFFGLVILLFAVAAILYWRKRKDMFLTTAGRAVGILQLFIYFVFTVITAINAGRFSYIMQSGILVNGLLLITYLFLIVGGFLKMKKPILAYVFAGIVALLILIGLITDGIATIQSLIAALRPIFNGYRFLSIWRYLLCFFQDLFNGCGNLLFYIGLLALNFTIFWNKVVPAEVPAIEETAEVTE